MDRALSRVVALPIFDDQFRQALIGLKLDCIEKVLVLEPDSGTDFIEKARIFASGSDSLIDVLIDRQFLCQTFVQIVLSSPKILDSISIELGFACDKGRTMQNDQSIGSAIQGIAADSFEEARAPKKAKTLHDRPTQLRTLEDQLSAKWSQRLGEIGDRAGDCAKINVSEGEFAHLLSDVEKERVKKLILSMGSFRTLQVHVRHWERFEEWAKGQSLCPYPPKLQMFVKYALFLQSSDCGVSVIPSFLTACNFVGSRLAIEMPDTRAHALKAITDQVIKIKGKETKEAVPFPIEVIRCLEGAVMVWTQEYPVLAVFTWWILVMIFGSLRFDDACHVDPTKLELTHEALFGVVWQTKTERKRRGTKFVVPLVGFSSKPWLSTGWPLFQAIEPKDRDFFLPEVGSKTRWLTSPCTYQRSLTWLKFVCSLAVELGVKKATISAEEAQRVMGFHKAVTWHSARCSMLSLAVHRGEAEPQIGLQGNWKNPGPMIQKYARDRKQVALQMVTRLIGGLRDEWKPSGLSAEDELEIEPELQSADPLEFFLKNSKRSSALTDLKFHVKALGLDESKTACRKFDLDDLCSVGTALPELSQICSECKKRRPELFD